MGRDDELQDGQDFDHETIEIGPPSSSEDVDIRTPISK